MRGEVCRERVERILDQRVIADGYSAAETCEPRRALTVIGEQAVDVSSDDAAVCRNGALR